MKTLNLIIAFMIISMAINTKAEANMFIVKEVCKILGIELTTDYVISGVAELIEVDKLPNNVNELVNNKKVRDTAYGLALEEKMIRDD